MPSCPTLQSVDNHVLQLLQATTPTTLLKKLKTTLSRMPTMTAPLLLSLNNNPTTNSTVTRLTLNSMNGSKLSRHQRTSRESVVPGTSMNTTKRRRSTRSQSRTTAQSMESKVFGRSKQTFLVGCTLVRTPCST